MSLLSSQSAPSQRQLLPPFSSSTQHTETSIGNTEAFPPKNKGKAMTCHNCNSHCKRFGKHRNGLQHYRCNQCVKTFTEEHERALDEMRLPRPELCTNLQAWFRKPHERAAHAPERRPQCPAPSRPVCLASTSTKGSGHPITSLVNLRSPCQI